MVSPRSSTSRAGRMLDRAAHFDDAFPLHENLAGPQHATGLDVEETGCVQHDGVRGLRLAGGIPLKREQQQTEKTQDESSGSHTPAMVPP